MVSKMANGLPHVVMIDDDEDDQYFFREHFKQRDENLIFKAFSSGEAFFRFYSSESLTYEKERLPSLILLDLNIPKDDGIEILMRLKQDPKLKIIPVLVLTTSSSPLDIEDCYDLGVHSYFVKPMSLQSTKELVVAIYEYWFNQNFISRLKTG